MPFVHAAVSQLLAAAAVCSGSFGRVSIRGGVLRSARFGGRQLAAEKPDATLGASIRREEGLPTKS